MKIRNGFVSNSSSSSFIIALDKPLKTFAQVLDTFYPDGRDVSCDYYDNTISSGDAAHMIFDQIKDKKPATKNELLDCVNGGWWDGRQSRNYSELKPSDILRREYREKHGFDIMDDKADKADKDKWTVLWRKEWDKEQAIERQHSEEYLDGILKTRKGKKFYIVHFGDEDGRGIMEHGNAFDNVDCIHISNH